MPVRKYRSIEDMPPVAPGRPLDPDNLRVACALSELALALHAYRIEPGVKKFRSLEDADRSRRESERQQAMRRRA